MQKVAVGKHMVMLPREMRHIDKCHNMRICSISPRVPKQNIADGIYVQYIISCSNIKLILRILGFSVKCSSWCCIIARKKLHETLRSHVDRIVPD